MLSAESKFKGESKYKYLQCTVNSCHQNYSWMYCIRSIKKPCNLLIVSLQRTKNAPNNEKPAKSTLLNTLPGNNQDIYLIIPTSRTPAQVETYF